MPLATKAYMNESERGQKVEAMLWERPPDQLDHTDFQGLFKNKADMAGQEGVPHGRGTLGVMAGHSRANPGLSPKVSIMLTENSSIESARATIAKNGWPAVINASHGGLNLEEDQEKNKRIISFLKEACRHNAVVSVAAGNGRVTNFPKDPEIVKCMVVVTSANAGLMKSTRSSEGELISVATSSDQYQQSSGMYHGWTSGAAPIISSALITAKKIMPNLSALLIKKAIENTADQIAGATYPNPKTGHGIFNGARFIKVLKLLKEGQISEADLVNRTQLSKKIIASYTRDANLFASPFSPESHLRSIKECGNVQQYFDKLKLTEKIVGADHPDHLKIKAQLQMFYELTGNLHSSILLDPRNSDGKIEISAKNFELLSKIQVKELGIEQQIKLLDLLKTTALSPGQLVQIKNNYKDLFVEAEKTVTTVTTLDPEVLGKKSAAMSLVRQAHELFGKDFIDAHISANSKIRSEPGMPGASNGKTKER